MKKYIVIAFAALAALAACTKTSPETAGNGKISFQVANYMPQTKANSSLDGEGYNAFNCYAWYFGAPMQYMNDVEVVKGTNDWAPANDYYWPKTGYINFYSYAGSQAPAVSASADMKTVTISYSEKTIGADDNFLVADPALHFGIGQANADLVTIDDEQGSFDYASAQYGYSASTQSYNGVPTLFHHMLAKVAFVAKLKTTTTSANTTWTVDILAGDKSNIKPAKTGTLKLQNTDEATAATIGAWKFYNGDTEITDAGAKAIGWVAAAGTETISFAAKTLTIEPEATESAQTDNVILPVRSVLPQTTEGLAFNLSYRVSASHGAETFMTEVIDVTSDLKTLVGAIPQWNMNQITVYTINIDPVGRKVTFDPAVVEWTSATGAISLPL